MCRARLAGCGEGAGSEPQWARGRRWSRRAVGAAGAAGALPGVCFGAVGAGFGVSRRLRAFRHRWPQQCRPRLGAAGSARGGQHPADGLGPASAGRATDAIGRRTRHEPAPGRRARPRRVGRPRRAATAAVPAAAARAAGRSRLSSCPGCAPTPRRRPSSAAPPVAPRSAARSRSLVPSSRYSAGVGAMSITVRASGVSPGLVCTKRRA